MESILDILKEAQAVVSSDLSEFEGRKDFFRFSVPEPSISLPLKACKSRDKKVVKTSKKRSWKKPKDKPKRPLSAYNLFFQHQRNAILASLPNGSEVINDGLTEEQRRKKHRKTHGKIGFADLAKIIAKKWKNCDETSKSFYEAQAENEKHRYKLEIEEWKNNLNLCDKSPQCQFPLDYAGMSPPTQNFEPNFQALNYPFSNCASNTMPLSSSLADFMPSAIINPQTVNCTQTRNERAHEAIMAQCASNLLQQSPGFLNYLGVLNRHLMSQSLPKQNVPVVDNTWNFDLHHAFHNSVPEESSSQEAALESENDDHSEMSSVLFSDDDDDESIFDSDFPSSFNDLSPQCLEL